MSIKPFSKVKLTDFLHHLASSTVFFKNSKQQMTPKLYFREHLSAETWPAALKKAIISDQHRLLPLSKENPSLCTLLTENLETTSHIDLNSLSHIKANLISYIVSKPDRLDLCVCVCVWDVLALWSQYTRAICAANKVCVCGARCQI